MGESDRAYERALSFLEKRDRTEREVLDKLRLAGFSEESAEAALERLRGAGLVNDEDYAERYLQALTDKGRGRLRIASEMRRKGLAEELIRNTIEDGLSPAREQEMATEAARRCMSGLDAGADPKKTAGRVSRRLLSLGFSWDTIGSAMREIRIEAEEKKQETEEA